MEKIGITWGLEVKMGYAKLKVEFPCGMKYEMILEGWGTPILDTEDLDCPLHGKKCKTSNNRRKEKSK